MKKIILILLLAAMTGCAGQGIDGRHPQQGQTERKEFAPLHEGSLFKLSEQGLFGVELLLKDGVLRVGSNSLDLILQGGEGKVEGARIKITPWMASHGHGVPVEPVVTEQGAGRYRAEKVLATMRGQWELRVLIEAGGRRDAAVFVFPEVDR